MCTFALPSRVWASEISHFSRYYTSVANVPHDLCWQTFSAPGGGNDATQLHEGIPEHYSSKTRLLLPFRHLQSFCPLLLRSLSQCSISFNFVCDLIAAFEKVHCHELFQIVRHLRWELSAARRLRKARKYSGRSDNFVWYVWDGLTWQRFHSK